MLLSQSIVLGIIQGITEWLPVSSSGHLVLAQKLMNLDVPVAFDVFLHFASLLVLLLFFWRDIIKILASLIKLDKKSQYFKLAILVIIGNLFTALIVFPLQNIFEKAFFNLFAVGIFFLITGILLFFSESNKKQKEISTKSAIIIGIAQGIAFLPGISRSGATIAAALLLGIKKDSAFKFSFLLAIPAIAGATLLKMKDIAIPAIAPLNISAAFLTAFVLGFASLLILKKTILRNNFHNFSYYCFAIGLITIIINFLI